MSSPSFPPLPTSMKPINAVLKTAADHDRLDPVVAYWLRLYAFQTGLKIDSQSKEAKAFLIAVITWLEQDKKQKSDIEAINNEIVAIAHMDNHATKLFDKADADDRAANATKNTSRLFYTASQIYDAMSVFSDVSEEPAQKSKYAKWRAAYIIKCLKNGDAPIPPEPEVGNNENASDFSPYPTDINSMSQPGHAPDNPFGGANTQFTSKEIHAPQTPNFPQTPVQQPPPPVQASSSVDDTVRALNGEILSTEMMQKSQKYCKWAASALDYEDISTAVKNLENALTILKIGSEQ